MADRSASGSGSGSGGVRNIRAMFEAKNEQVSPPSRGRSPAGGSESVRSSSSRPISKVRTSFVAVEKSGLLGLRKASDVGDTSASSASKIEEEAIDTESKEPGNTPHADSANKGEDSKNEEPPAKQSKLVSRQKSSLEPSSDVKVEKAQLDGLAESTVPETSNTGSEKAKGNIQSAPKPRAEGSKPHASSAKSTRPSLPLGSGKNAATGNAAAGKSPTTSSQSSTKKSTTTQSKPARTDSTSKSKPVSKVSSPKLSSPKISSSGSGPAAKKVVKEASAFTKPKPKSPTKPTGPRTSDGDFFSRMMRPTQSSSSKTHDANQSTSSSKPSTEQPSKRTSTSRTSGNDGDFLSRMMKPTASSSSKTHESDAKDSKPLSAKVHRDATKPTEGGFMARMMKPTASSASKTHEKTATTNSPPRGKTEADLSKLKAKNDKHLPSKQPSKAASGGPKNSSKPFKTPSKASEPAEIAELESAPTPSKAQTPKKTEAQSPKAAEQTTETAAESEPKTPQVVEAPAPTEASHAAPAQTPNQAAEASKATEAAPVKTPTSTNAPQAVSPSTPASAPEVPAAKEAAATPEKTLPPPSTPQPVEPTQPAQASIFGGPTSTSSDAKTAEDGDEDEDEDQNLVATAFEAPDLSAKPPDTTDGKTLDAELSLEEADDHQDIKIETEAQVNGKANAKQKAEAQHEQMEEGELVGEAGLS